MLVSDIISSALRKIGGLSSGETIEPARQAEALLALKVMLRSWGALSMNVFATAKESCTLTAGTGSYTWGVGGVINSARPNQVIGAYILESGTSYPVNVITEGVYRSISVKATTGIPNSLFLHSAYPLATVYLYPVPDSAYTLYLDSYKPFTEVGSFNLTTDQIVFPSYYEEPIIYNLAVRLAPEYGKNISTEVGAIAKTSYDALVTANSSGRVEQIFLKIPGDAPYGSMYSVNSNMYR